MSSQLPNSNRPRVEEEDQFTQRDASTAIPQLWEQLQLLGIPALVLADGLTVNPARQFYSVARKALIFGASLRQQLAKAQNATLNGCPKPHRLDELDFAGCAACAWDAYHEQRGRAEKAEQELSSLRAVRTLAAAKPEQEP
jgi:hypothetical protein